jgi:hypothetical protein
MLVKKHKYKPDLREGNKEGYIPTAATRTTRARGGAEGTTTTTTRKRATRPTGAATAMA